MIGKVFGSLLGANRRNLLVLGTGVFGGGLLMRYSANYGSRFTEEVHFEDSQPRYRTGGFFDESQDVCPIVPVLGKNVVIAAGPSSVDVARGVAGHLGTQLMNIEVGNFRDGETFIKLNENVNGKDVIIIQSCSKPVNESIMELIFLITTMKRNGANSVSTFIPYFAYARQERKTGAYKCLSPADVCNLLESSGLDRCYLMDPHVDTIPAFFTPRVQAEFLLTSDLGASYFSSKTKLENPLVVSPDAGAERRAKMFTDRLRAYEGYEQMPDPVIVIKHRSAPGEVGKSFVTGDVTGKDCIIVDDMCDSGGTLMACAKNLKEQGAASVRAYIGHGLFSGDFYTNLANSSLVELVVTDSLKCYRPELENSSKVTRVPISKLIADEIYVTFGDNK